jgi:plastocyanin
VAVFGDTLLTAASLPASAGEKPMIIAYRLGATGTIPTSAPPPSTTTAPTTSNPATTTSSPSTAGSVNLSASGTTLAFNTNNATANAGTVSVDFANNSALQHDVVLTDPQNKILGQTPVFQGGSKSFSTTLAPGTYTYYCSVPGHRQAGMQGTLTVK